jgi:peptide deformylase
VKLAAGADMRRLWERLRVALEETGRRETTGWGGEEPSMIIGNRLREGSERDPAASLALRTLPDSVLRLVCEPVDTFDRSLRELVEEMRQLMQRHQGIGLAAPQAGVRQQLFVGEIDGRRLSVVNPRLQACGAGSEEGVEGCLSLPGVEVPVTRAKAVEVRGRTPEGQALSFVAEGLWARLVQHEVVDHLNGRLICDYAPAAAVPGRTRT